jgi:hypothetical protein
MKLNQSILIHPGIKQSILYAFGNGIILIMLTWLWFIGGILISTYIDWQYITELYMLVGVLILYTQLMISKCILPRQYYLSFYQSLGIGFLCMILAFVLVIFLSYDGNAILIYYIFSIGLGSILLCECTKTRLQFTLLYIVQIVGTVGLFLIVK